MKPITLTMNERLIDALAAYAKQTGLSKSDIVRRSVEVYLEANKPEKEK